MATAHLALAADIDELRKQFESLSAAADALTAPLTDEQFVWQPPQDHWSVAQCIEHLNAYARQYLPRLDDAIADAISRGLYAEGPFKYNGLGRLLVRLNEPPPLLRFTSQAKYRPGPPRSRQEVLAAFRAYQVQYIDRLHQANGLDLARARVSAPTAPWVRLPLGSGFLLMAAHERRHLHQAERVVRSSSNPR